MTINISQAWIDRPDLALMKFTRPMPCGTRFLPSYTCTQLQDVVVYMPQRSTLTTQDARANGAALEVNMVNNTRKAIDLVPFKVEETAAKDITEFPENGTEENTWRQLGFNALFGLSMKIELRIAKALLDAKAAIAVTGTTEAKARNAFLAEVQKQVMTVASQTGSGRVAVGMSQQIYRTIVGWPEFAAMVKAAVTLPVTQAIDGIANIQKMQMAALFNCDEVLTGQDVAWYSATITARDAVFVGVLPTPGMDAQMEIQLGRSAAYIKHIAAPTPTEANEGKGSYDDSLLVPGSSATSKIYAAPWSCAQAVFAANSTAGIVAQSFVQPLVFNVNLCSIVAMPTVGASV